MKPIVLSAPAPRSLDLIFTPDKLKQLRETYEVVETTDDTMAALPTEMLRQARYILGQPPISKATLALMGNSRPC